MRLNYRIPPNGKQMRLGGNLIPVYIPQQADNTRRSLKVQMKNDCN
jgi:hypothetical protein